jgi:hypothetical protein
MAGKPTPSQQKKTDKNMALFRNRPPPYLDNNNNISYVRVSPSPPYYGDVKRISLAMFAGEIFL